jgi:hypothetical protein
MTIEEYRRKFRRVITDKGKLICSLFADDQKMTKSEGLTVQKINNYGKNKDNEISIFGAVVTSYSVLVPQLRQSLLPPSSRQVHLSSSWRRQVPPKRRYSITKLHIVTFQKTIIFNTKGVRTSITEN